MTEAPAKPVYSVSSLMVYELCPLQYYTTFVRGIPPPRSKAMETGTNVHKLIADFLRQRTLLPPHVEPSVQEMLETFKRSRFNLAPVAIEKPFVLPFERADVRGRIDLILPRPEKGLEVVDFKSGTARSREELERSLQLPLYSLASARLFDHRLEDMAYTYYFLRDGVEVPFSPGPGDFQQLTLRVEDIMQAIQAGQFDPPLGCKCHACRWHRRFRERSTARSKERG